jgi:hypothetical protein
MAIAQDAPPPPPAGVLPETELPPAPVLQKGQKGSDATVAHGVTVVPDSKPRLEVFGRDYAAAYRSIPFNRAEYDANPSYRHDAAMELLFGQMRPTTIVKQMPAPNTDQPQYSPYKRFIPAYGDFESYQALPLPYPLFGGGRPNLPYSEFWNY